MLSVLYSFWIKVPNSCRNPIMLPFSYPVHIVSQTLDSVVCCPVYLTDPYVLYFQYSTERYCNTCSVNLVIWKIIILVQIWWHFNLKQIKQEGKYFSWILWAERFIKFIFMFILLPVILTCLAITVCEPDSVSDGLYNSKQSHSPLGFCQWPVFHHSGLLFSQCLRCITSEHECGARGITFVKIRLVCNAEEHGWGWKLESTVELLLHWHVRERDYSVKHKLLVKISVTY